MLISLQYEYIPLLAGSRIKIEKSFFCDTFRGRRLDDSYCSLRCVYEYVLRVNMKRCIYKTDFPYGVSEPLVLDSDPSFIPKIELLMVECVYLEDGRLFLIVIPY